MPTMAIGLGVAVWMVVAADARSLPDPGLTPGALNPAVTEATIGTTICVRGWTRSVRPPAEYTEALKRRQIREYGYADRRLRSYEEDHLVPLDLGGSPDNSRNLWPEPREAVDGWNADRKDELEAVLVRLVCSHQVPLREGAARYRYGLDRGLSAVCRR